HRQKAVGTRGCGVCGKTKNQPARSWKRSQGAGWFLHTNGQTIRNLGKHQAAWHCAVRKRVDSTGSPLRPQPEIDQEPRWPSASEWPRKVIWGASQIVLFLALFQAYKMV